MVRVTAPASHASRHSVRWVDARYIEVVARLQSGVAIPPVFPAPLDGILAGAMHRRTMGATYGSGIDHHTQRLPLCIHKHGCGAQWVWAASCAVPIDGAGTEVRWWHNRGWDEPAAETVGVAVPANTEVGRWKAWRTPIVVTLTPTLRWRAVGDPDGVRELLADVVQVGHKRSQGEGLVLAWEVQDLGRYQPGDNEVDRTVNGVLWHDGRPARPIPARAAAWFGVAGCDTVPHQIRPPYWRPAQTGVEGGGFARAPREVIAPWVRLAS